MLLLNFNNFDYILDKLKENKKKKNINNEQTNYNFK